MGTLAARRSVGGGGDSDRCSHPKDCAMQLLYHRFEVADAVLDGVLSMHRDIGPLDITEYA